MSTALCDPRSPLKKRVSSESNQIWERGRERGEREESRIKPSSVAAGRSEE